MSCFLPCRALLCNPSYISASRRQSGICPSQTLSSTTCSSPYWSSLCCILPLYSNSSKRSTTVAFADLRNSIWAVLIVEGVWNGSKSSTTLPVLYKLLCSHRCVHILISSIRYVLSFYINLFQSEINSSSSNPWTQQHFGGCSLFP